MSYLALARKWRPKIFNEVMGQTHVIQALSNALDTGKVHHAFLFTGTRGVGKTTLARIFAKSLNCETGMTSTPCGQCSTCVNVDQGRFIDLVEVDAASRTGIDDMRELLDNIQYAPSQGRYKVYLIDEIHMLSKSSFNALLKTLEEPPEHVKFLFATTDPQKLPVTVLSRCLQFNLKALQVNEIIDQISKILQQEGIEFDQQGVELIARAADGSLRDSLSLLEQAIAQGGGSIDVDLVRAMLGTVKASHMDELLQAIIHKDVSMALTTIDSMAIHAVDFTIAIDQLLIEIHHIALAQFAVDALQHKVNDIEKYKKLAQQITPEDIQLCYQIGLIAKRDIALAPDYRSGFEMAVLRIIAFKPDNQEGQKQVTLQQSSVQQPTQQSPAQKTSPTVTKVEKTMVNEPTEQQVQQVNQSAKPAILHSKVAAIVNESPKQVEPEGGQSQAQQPQHPLPQQSTGANAATKSNDQSSSPAVLTANSSTDSIETISDKTSVGIKVTDLHLNADKNLQAEVSRTTTNANIDLEMPSDRVEPSRPSVQQKVPENRGIASDSSDGTGDITANVDDVSQSSIKQEPSLPTLSETQAALDDGQYNAPNIQDVSSPQITDQRLDNNSAESFMNESLGLPEEPQVSGIPDAPTNEWAGFVEMLELNGLVKELAVNMACADINANPMRLYLHPDYAYLKTEPREMAIRDEIKKLKGANSEIDIVLEATVQETPSERIQRLQSEFQENTTQEVKANPKVQDFAQAFGMKIDESTIKPK